MRALQSLKLGAKVIVGGFFLFIQAALGDPPNLADLATRPSLWPKQVALTEAISFKASGSAAAVQLPVGTVGEVISIQAQGVGVDFNGTTLMVPLNKTDLIARLPDQANRAAEDAKRRDEMRAAMPKPTAENKPKPSAAARPGNANFVQSFASKLQILEGDKLATYPADSINKAEYFVFYFSASWCGPCRKFTPKLVEFYNKVHPQTSRFQVIFVSRDRSAQDMTEYMALDKMPWPAISYDSIESIAPVTALRGPGIPCVVVTDRTGKVLADSFDGEKYLGPDKPIQALIELLKKKT